MNLRNEALFFIIALVLGLFGGAVLWLLLLAVNGGIAFFWDYLASIFDYSWYPFVVCAVGGLFIGLNEKFLGVNDLNVDRMLTKAEHGREFPLKKVLPILITMFLPLVFGGCIGPEAGAAMLLASICYGVSECLHHKSGSLLRLPKVGIAAALSVIFASPLFGVIAVAEEPSSDGTITWPRPLTLCVYLSAAFGAYASFYFLQKYLGGQQLGLYQASFGSFTMPINRWFLLIPIALIGGIFGQLSVAFSRISTDIAGLIKNPFIKGVVGGLFLAVFAFLVPCAMFSGEYQITTLQQNWQLYSVLGLLVIAIAKLLLPGFCIAFGWRGGYYFPVILSGIALGFAIASFTGWNSTFCVAVITSSLVAGIMGKPISAIFLMALLFPSSSLLPIGLAAVIGAAVPSAWRYLQWKFKKEHAKRASATEVNPFKG